MRRCNLAIADERTSSKSASSPASRSVNAARAPVQSRALGLRIRARGGILVELPRAQDEPQAIFIPFGIRTIGFGHE
jgi:hypothetical protein